MRLRIATRQSHAAQVDERRRRTSFEIVTLPMPGVVGGTSTRHAHLDQLPASYANFYIANNVVLAPVFGHANDARAGRNTSACFPIDAWSQSTANHSFGAWARSTASPSNNLNLIDQLSSFANRILESPHAAVQLHLVNCSRDLAHAWSRLHAQLDRCRPNSSGSGGRLSTSNSLALNNHSCASAPYHFSRGTQSALRPSESAFATRYKRSGHTPGQTVNAPSPTSSRFL